MTPVPIEYSPDANGRYGLLTCSETQQYRNIIRQATYIPSKYFCWLLNSKYSKYEELEGREVVGFERRTYRWDSQTMLISWIYGLWGNLHFNHSK